MSLFTTLKTLLIRFPAYSTIAISVRPWIFWGGPAAVACREPVHDREKIVGRAMHSVSSPDRHIGIHRSGRYPVRRQHVVNAGGAFTAVERSADVRRHRSPVSNRGREPKAKPHSWYHGARTFTCRRWGRPTAIQPGERAQDPEAFADGAVVPLESDSERGMRRGETSALGDRNHTYYHHVN